MTKYEQPLQVASYTKTTDSDTEEAKYMIKIRKLAKFMVGFGDIEHSNDRQRPQ